MGKSLFFSTLRVEMNSHTKQYKGNDIMGKLLKVDAIEEGGIGLMTDIDWDHCE
ncbi:LOW QUALITY PROTEIN: hypothetical protein ACHAW5_004180 [Stephanodiscus triporus]|uniref:Uncharacterized protein n=1 Tax=Stephanodiscus triporus TaxID=2934178 RepID=A0ABD3MS80_9STRA